MLFRSARQRQLSCSILRPDALEIMVIALLSLWKEVLSVGIYLRIALILGLPAPYSKWAGTQLATVHTYERRICGKKNFTPQAGQSLAIVIVERSQ